MEQNSSLAPKPNRIAFQTFNFSVECLQGQTWAYKGSEISGPPNLAVRFPHVEY